MVLTGVCSYCSNTLWGNGKDSLYAVLVLHHPQRNSRISKERCRNEHLPPSRAQGLVCACSRGAARPAATRGRCEAGNRPRPAAGTLLTAPEQVQGAPAGGCTCCLGALVWYRVWWPVSASWAEYWTVLPCFLHHLLIAAYSSL